MKTSKDGIGSTTTSSSSGYIFEVDTPTGPGCVAPINMVVPGLFIGDHNAASSRKILSNHGVTHIVNCAYEIADYFRTSDGDKPITYYRLDLMDEEDDMETAVEEIYSYIVATLKSNPSNKILVHCHMGKSRSASVVIYYLMKSFRLTYEQALKKLKDIRPIVQPNPHYEKILSKIKV